LTYVLGPIKFQNLEEYFIFVLSKLLNKGIFVGPYCEKNALDVPALQSEDLKPLEREHLTVGLVLELWKKNVSVKQMQRWITALTPVELQKYLSGVTSQNLNKACNDLLKKSQKLAKNKKKEELELLKQSLFHLPGSNAPMAREQLTPKSKAIAELRNENRGLKRSVSKILSFNERLMDEQDALITDQAALEEEYFSTVEHMRMLTNNIAGVAAKRKHERDALEKDMKVL